VPSRYTVRATTDDGRLVLWNTFNGRMSVFRADQADGVKLLLRRPGLEAQEAGMARYLFDRGYLIREGTDEYRQVQLAFGQQHYRTEILQLILLSSEDCNFRCQYCYEDFPRGTMEPWVRAAIKKLVDKRMRRLKEFYVTWFGGEPLYGFKAIEELSPYFLEAAAANSVRYQGNITTNGYLLTPEVAEKLLAWQVTRYQITLDGRAEDHDHNRPGRDGSGTFWTIFENLKSLSQRPEDYQVTIRVNFDRKNSPHMVELLDLIQRDLGTDQRFLLRFHNVGRWGGPNDEKLDVCGLDEASRVRFDLKQEARKRGLNIGRGIKDVNGFGAEACYAARPYNFIIGASGKLMKCTVALDKEDFNVLGRITEDGELEMDKDKLALWTEPAFETDGKCRKCVVLPECQGLHCPLVRMEESRSPCTSLRHTLKPALLETVELMSMSKGKPVTVDKKVPAAAS